MSVSLDKAREAIGRCLRLRQEGALEAVLRGELQSHLRGIFPDESDESWINHYGEGAEAHTKIGTGGGAAASRFVDNLVGSTTIEYEADLRIQAKFNEGFHQVKEHAAGLIRRGVPVSQVRGVLADTVEWHAYDVELVSGSDPHDCSTDDIVLVEVDSLMLEVDDEPSAERLTLFLRKHLARQQSRPLIADNLAFDLGLESSAYRRNASTLTALVQDGRAHDSSVELATDLWSRFVDHLEGEGNAFRVDPYVDEVYLNILARLLSANALAGSAIVSDEDELRAILDGSYFRDKYQLDNLVEKDYFGWIVHPSHIAGFLPVTREMQRDLYAYDFSWRAEEDLFGRLMSQLARRSQRRLLGQEWTPSWLARHLAERCLYEIPAEEEPEIVDMCCGSGAILAEILKVVKAHQNVSDIASLNDIATGFDIDPLAVALAKTTWVITLADEIKSAAEPVHIPVYHADSLFAVTPVSASLPMLGEAEGIEISLDGEKIELPAGLLRPEYRELFDRLVDWAYDEAQQVDGAPLTAADAEASLDTAIAASEVTLSSELRDASAHALFALAHRMKELSEEGRNGIWAFILRNTYRPGLLAGQFNGLVSNPPWLAMSVLADNPYRELLSRRATRYGLRPAGQSFLHLELGTMHLLHAVDRYLKPEAAVACLVPGTILNGNHHEQFRQGSYLHSDRSVAFSVCEVWQVAPGTFKYPGAALIGKKATNVEDAATTVGTGAVAKPEGVEVVDFSIRKVGTDRTAWVLERDGLPAAPAGQHEVSQQGADLMPRSAVCVDLLNDNGTEYRVDTPRAGSTWAFTMKQSKRLKNEYFPGYVAPCFIHKMAQSENLLPFVFGGHCAPVAIPACQDGDRAWQIYEPAEIRRMGFTRTARRFAEVNAKLATIGNTTLEYRIDFRRKLRRQQFDGEGYVVLSGAGGTYICAACITLAEAKKLVIDQTVYWQIVTDQNDAWFRTGFLNSSAMTDAILPFNPKGDFGPRHIHTLPYRLMPSYDATNDDHRAVAKMARSVAQEAATIVAGEPYIGNPNRALPARRRKLCERLSQTENFQELDRLCGSILGINPALDE